MEKAVLVLNGKAGNSFGKRNAYQLISKLYEQGIECLVIPVGSGEKTDLGEMLERYRDMFQLVICAGGDGTLHHTVNAMLKGKHDAPIFYYPCGTTNDFAKSLGLEPNLNRKEKLIGDTLIPVDAGLFNKEYFTYVAAFGALTEVSYSTDQDAKNVLGYTAYALNSLRLLPGGLSTRIKVTVESDEYTGTDEYMYGSVSNCYSVAGIRSPLLADVSLEDGYFETALIRSPNSVEDLFEIITELTDEHADITNSRHIRLFRTRKVRFTFEEKVSWTLDGEFGGEMNKALIQVRKHAFTIRK